MQEYRELLESLYWNWFMFNGIQAYILDVNFNKRDSVVFSIVVKIKNANNQLDPIQDLKNQIEPLLKDDITT